jgi:5-methylcytosine-specific restriction protein B
MTNKNFQELQEIWDAFLAEWPLERIRTMTLEDYTSVGQSHTFTAWIESRLDKMGSIWGGSAFKFGIFSRKDKTPKTNTASDSYTQDYAWYTKYASTPEDAFAKVKSLVLHVAEAAARGDYAAIDAVDLGEAYKWKIAYHYQDRQNPGVVAVFKPKRLQAWLKGKVGTIPTQTSELYRQILMLKQGKDLIELSQEVWKETAAEDTPVPTGNQPVLDDDEGLDPEVPLDLPLNLILYGPPGTGKTYCTAELAVRACDGVVPESREALMARYRELRNLQRIRFVTFHPSFTYEEFVEGIRPSTADDGKVRYDVRPGVLKKAVTLAREMFEKRTIPVSSVKVQGRKLFKMSLGDTAKVADDWIFPDCVDHGYVGLGFASGINFTGSDGSLQAVRDLFKTHRPDAKDTDYSITAVHYLKNEIKKGDLILISDGNTKFRGVAEVTGDYFYTPSGQFEQRRSVRWLWTSAESLPIDMIFSKRLSQMSIYLMDQDAVKWEALQELLTPKRTGGVAPNCVLVIDEINRANLAKTFGELITLLEPSKRLGQPDEHETELPYSGDMLGVPPNLYVIGTMNTADRSIALMDTALRRRFAFREMSPRKDLLEVDVEGINLQALLEAMNTRIEALFDRDHILGHTYLMGVATFADLVDRFRSQIIPLLQEYFFEDWRRIQQIFVDEGEPSERQIIQDLDRLEDGSSPRDRRQRFRVNPNIPPAAIQKIYA